MRLVKEGAVVVWSADGTEANTDVGIVLNVFEGFVRLRLLERKPDNDGDDTHAYVMALPVDCFPVRECSEAGVKVSADDMGDEPDIERTGVVVHIPSKARDAARNRTPRRAPVPVPGTLTRVFRASSPTPASRCPTPFVLKESELCAVGLAPGTLGVFATEDLPKGYYVGELLGETGWNVATFEDAAHRHVWPVSRIPTYSLTTGLRTRRRNEEITDYIDSQDPDTSSFLRYVNAALPPARVSRVGDAGYGNCEFVQMQERVYLRTTTKVKAGKELLAPTPNNPTPAGVTAKASAVLSGLPAKRAKLDGDERKTAAAAKAEAAKQKKKDEEEAEQKEKEREMKREKKKRKQAAKVERAAACAAAKKASSALAVLCSGGGGGCALAATAAAVDGCLLRDDELPAQTAEGAKDQFVPKVLYNDMKRQAEEAELKALRWEAAYREEFARAYIAESKLKRLGFTIASRRGNK